MNRNESAPAETRQLAPRITSNPDIMNGKPVIAGTRMPVDLLIERLAYRHPFEELLDDYPYLTAEDIYAALEYAAEAIRHENERERAAS